MNNETFQADIGQFEREDKYKKIVDEIKEWLGNERAIGNINYSSIMEYVIDKIKELEDKYD